MHRRTAVHSRARREDGNIRQTLSPAIVATPQIWGYHHPLAFVPMCSYRYPALGVHIHHRATILQTPRCRYPANLGVSHLLWVVPIFPLSLPANLGVSHLPYCNRLSLPRKSGGITSIEQFIQLSLRKSGGITSMILLRPDISSCRYPANLGVSHPTNTPRSSSCRYPANLGDHIAGLQRLLLLSLPRKSGGITSIPQKRSASSPPVVATPQIWGYHIRCRRGTSRSHTRGCRYPANLGVSHLGADPRFHMSLKSGGITSQKTGAGKPMLVVATPQIWGYHIADDDLHIHAFVVATPQIWGYHIRLLYIGLKTPRFSHECGRKLYRRMVKIRLGSRIF